jgi:hypothetical protein
MVRGTLFYFLDKKIRRVLNIKPKYYIKDSIEWGGIKKWLQCGLRFCL